MRYSTGCVIGAMCERVSLPISPAVVEALACTRALAFAKELCIFECSVEGDVEVIINAILIGDSKNPKYGHVIGDILVLATGLGLCNFSFVKCIGNSVAHFLARKAISGSELQVWIESTPVDI